MDLSAQALQDFEADLLAAANARGVELTADDIQEVFARTVQSGSFTPLAMRAVLDEHLVTQGVDPFEDDYEDEEEDESNPGLERLARDFHSDRAALEDRIGRPLRDAEIDRLTATALGQVERGYTRIDLETPFADHEEKMGTPGGRAEFYKQRLGEQAAEHRAERVEQMTAGRELDLNDDKDRQDYLVARMAGVEFQDAGAAWEDD